MSFIKKLAFAYRRWRGRARRLKRIIFMSPAEARFVELMGGKVYRLLWLRHPRNHFPATIVLSMGTTLGREKFKREVRIGKHFVDFANDVGRIIEIDGQSYHMDILADMFRDQYLADRGWRVMRIQAHRLYNDANAVQRDVLRFID